MNKYQSSKAKTDSMTKEPITFDKLPQAVSYLTEQVEKIYQLVETLQPQRLDHQHQLIDIDKASILIQKSKPTIYRLARTGLIPAYKRGKKLYFYEDELLKWIEAGKKQSQPLSYQEQSAQILKGMKRKPRNGVNI